MAITAFLLANLMNFGPVFEVNAQTALFCCTVLLVLIAVFCEERRRRLMMWRFFKKDI